MRWTARAWAAALRCALPAALGLSAAPAPAQDGATRLINTPAEQFATAPGGVDMRTGRYAYSETDLSIGGEGGALALTRIMAPSVAGHANPFANLSHNWDIMITELRISFDNPAVLAGDYQINVHYGGRSQTFRGRNSPGWAYEQASSGPHATLTWSGDRAGSAVVYTYTAPDGTVAVFRALGGGDCSNERRCAFVSQVTDPDGTVYTFDYTGVTPTSGPGGNQRLSRVTSSRGYALLLEGTEYRVTKACVINLAEAPAPGSGLCPGNAPATASYGYTGGNVRLAAATGPDGGTSGFTYSGDTMGFVRPGEATPWLTNTLQPAFDEEWSPVEIVTHQSFADGQSYSYAFDYSPLVADRPQTVAGGSYVHSGGGLSRTVSVRYGWPLLHGANNPGSPCSQPWPPCPPPGPDDFLHYTYQQTSGPIQVIDALGRTIMFDHCDPIPMAELPPEENNRCVVVPLVSFTDPEGARTALEYDGHRNVTRATRVARPGSGLADIVTSAVYDIANPRSSMKPLSMTDGRGNTTDYSYAPQHGGVLTETGPAVGGVRPQTRHAYAQRHAWLSDGAGGWVQAATPVWVRVSTSTCRTSAATGNPAAPCAAAGDEVLTVYDYGPDAGPNNLLLRGTAVSATDAGVTVTLRTCYAYDALGRRISETRPNAALGSCPGSAPGSAQPWTVSTRYDALGRVTGTIGPDPDGAGWLEFPAVRNTYDAAGRLIKVETGVLASWQPAAVAPSAWSGFAVHRSVETQYDAMGRKVRDTAREGAAGAIRAVTQYSYDGLGRLECTAARMNPADFAAPPGSACAQGTGGADRIARSVHDAADQRLQLRVGVGTGVEGAEASWSHNLNGQVTTVIDGNGNRAELRYDGHGRQDRWTFPSATGPSAYDDSTPVTALATAGSVNASDYEEYGYDANGNRTSLRRRDATTLTYGYDALNRMTVKVVPERAGLDPMHTRDVFYGYDLRGLQLFARFDSASGEGVINQYDGFGRLVLHRINLSAQQRTLTYQHDRNANRTRIAHPDGTFFTYEYDGLDRPLYYRTNGTTLTAYQGYYQHGGLGDRILTNGASVLWGYDGLQRRSGLTLGAAGTAADAVWVWSHNPAGQVASITRDNDAYAFAPSNASVTYTADGLNRYTAVGGASFTYDANGNLTSDGTRTYLYDVENRLVGASGGVTLVYDPLGRLYEVIGPSGTTRFLYDGDALVAEYNSTGGMIARYMHDVTGTDVPMLSYPSSALTQPSWLHADRLGSIVLVTNAAGVGTINSYDEYGVPAATNVGRFQYTGQIWIPEIGMYHYKSRLYSPHLGRFMQTDPVGYEDQFNLYAYVGNDPVNARDPNGRQGVWGPIRNMRRRAERVVSGAIASSNRHGTVASAMVQFVQTKLDVARAAALETGATARDVAPITALRRAVPIVGGIITYHSLRQEGYSVVASGAGAAADEGSGAAIGALIGTAVLPGVGTVIGGIAGYAFGELTGIPSAIGSATADAIDRAADKLSEFSAEAAEALNRSLLGEETYDRIRGNDRN